MNPLILGALALAGLGAISMKKKKDEEGTLEAVGGTAVKGPISGQVYAVTFGERGANGDRLASVFGSQGDLLLVYIEHANGGRTLFNALPNPNLAEQSETAAADFGLD